MKKLYILLEPKSWVQEWFRNKLWLHEGATSIIIRKKKDGKLIQVLAQGKLGDYNYLNEQTVELISDETLRFMDYGKVITFSDEVMENVELYVLR